MPIWDHLSLVSKETIFWRCTNFSDFCNFWKTFSDDNSQKKDQRVIHEPVFVTHDWQLEGNIPSFSWITLSSNFLGFILRKWFPKVAKITEISASSENCFFGNKTQVILKGYLKTSEAYFIKWTTSGEPPVCLKSHQGSKWSHSKAIL